MISQGKGKVQTVVQVPCFSALDASTYNIAYNIVSVVMLQNLHVLLHATCVFRVSYSTVAYGML